MKFSKIYVTGANGFIGRYVVKHLSRHFSVVALLRTGSIPGFRLNNNITVVYGDLTDYNSLMRSIPLNSIIINLAANPYHPSLSYKVNVDGTANLIRAAQKRQAELIIHVSSQATKIARQGVYAKTKNASDAIVKTAKLPFVILKPSLVYGEGERGLFNKIRLLAKLLPVVPIFGDGKSKLYPIYAEDFAEIIERVINNPSTHSKVYDVGAETSITYNELYAELAPRLIHIPVRIGLFLAWLCKFLPNPPIYRDNVLGSTQSTFCKPKPILQLLKFHPRNFSEGISKMKGDQKLKVAVVGLGKMGTLHLSILSTFENVKIVALVDTNKQLFSTVHSMGIPGDFYSSLTEALANQAIDAVYILTPTFTHFEILKTALAQNLHVFLEKPAFLNAQQLDEAKRIKTNRVVHIGYTLLYSRIYLEVKRILESRQYGKIVGFTANFEHGEVFGPKQGWMFNKKLSGGGVLMNPGPHFFSLLQLFFGKPNNVDGKIKCKYVPGLDDEAHLQLGYGTFAGEVTLSWSVKGRVIPRNYFEIQLDKAKLITDGMAINILPRRGKSIKIVEEDIPVVESIFDINPKANGGAYYLESQAFIEAIAGKRPGALNTLKFALESESTIFEVYKKCLK